MKYVLIYFLLISTAFASPPPESFLNAKAGVTLSGMSLSGGNQPELSESYSFSVAHVKEHLCRVIDGITPRCGWKKLEGEGRYLLVRLDLDEVTGEKTVHSIVFEQSSGVVYIKRYVVDKVDLGREGLSQLSIMMIRLEGEYKATKK